MLSAWALHTDSGSVQSVAFAQAMSAGMGGAPPWPSVLIAVALEQPMPRSESARTKRSGVAFRMFIEEGLGACARQAPCSPRRGGIEPRTRDVRDARSAPMTHYGACGW